MNEGLSKAAYAEFIKMSADGTLRTIDEAGISGLAAAVSDNPVIQEAMLSTYYGSLMASEFEAEEAERVSTWNRMRSDRRAAMFRFSDIDAETAGRLAFDEMAGDPSGMLKLKERFFFG